MTSPGPWAAISISIVLLLLVAAATVVFVRWPGSDEIPAAGGGSDVNAASMAAGGSPPAGLAAPPVADLRRHGAACDGRADDRGALVRAIVAAKRRGDGVVTVSGICRISLGPPITLEGPITVRGATRGATLALGGDGPGEFAGLFTVTGRGVRIADLRMRREAATSGVMVILVAASAVRLDRVVIDGQKDRFPEGDFHGIAIAGAAGDQNGDISLTRSIIEDTDYGLFQDNAVASTLVGFRIDRSTFRRNHDDDVEFNAPNGSMTDISVTRSTFRNNQRPPDRPEAGFGVGMANVQQARIVGNRFEGYEHSPIHIEDRSAFIVVARNTFANAATAPFGFASHVFVVAGSHDILVRRNRFDTSANANPVTCVFGAPGGGDPVGAITVTGNVFRLRPNATAVATFGAPGVTESGNTTRRLA